MGMDDSSHWLHGGTWFCNVGGNMSFGGVVVQVMAAAMAETGQITLFGEKPTIAEATLARARKRVFYNERYATEVFARC